MLKQSNFFALDLNTKGGLLPIGGKKKYCTGYKNALAFQCIPSYLCHYKLKLKDILKSRTKGAIVVIQQGLTLSE